MVRSSSIDRVRVKQMQIVLQETLRGLLYAPFYAALALEAYREEGVDVRFVSASRPSEAARGLLDGTVDVTWGGPMRVMETYDKQPNCDLVCFCEVVTRDPFCLVGRGMRPDFRLSDLMGTRIATVSEVPTPWLCLQDDLRRAGLDPGAIDRVSDRSMVENLKALRDQKIAAAQLFEPFIEEALDDGTCGIWYAAAERGPTSYTTFYARRPLLADRREELKAMVRAIYRTQKWFHATPSSQIAREIAGFFSDQPDRRLTAAIDRYKRLGIWGKNPRLPKSGYDRLRAGLVSGDFVARGTDYEVAVDNALAEQVIGEDPPLIMR
jgi:NitT/TauT family transport system substrate-binding protein